MTSNFNRMMLKTFVMFALTMLSLLILAQENEKKITVGAEQTSKYFNLLSGKNIAIVANQTSLIGESHLVDSLLKAGFSVMKIFSPEHGFRGRADAGELIDNKIDLVTGLPIISLYGNNKKPQPEDLEIIDMVIFDIQDVGARFYTYISTLTYVMEACAEKSIPVMILDRPNPNGFYVDGPVMEPEFASFVGLHPVPIVHGMTVGEYARMVNGEYWLADSLQCDLTIIPVENYTHNHWYELPMKPSPNLPNKYAVYLYPSVCLFEGTEVSVGRGTEYPFQVIGHPDFLIGSYLFVPRSIPGASVNPKFEGKYCTGINLLGYAKEMNNNRKQLNLSWLIEFYEVLGTSGNFFNNYFEKLAGTASLRKQIEARWTEEQIRQSWQPGLENFRKIRKKYLLYPDVEEKNSH